MDVFSLTFLLGAIVIADEVLNGQLKLSRRLLERHSSKQSRQQQGALRSGSHHLPETDRF